MQNGSERNELLFCIVEVQPILLLNNKKHYNRTRHTGQYKIKNMRRLKNNHILCLLAVALCVVCIMSVYTPVNFDENRTKREQTVKLRLVQIRNAEERYRTLHGVYADNFAELKADFWLTRSAIFPIPEDDGLTSQRQQRPGNPGEAYR